MIHTIEVDASTEIAALKKLARKKLMTGGAVIRLSPSLSTEEQNLVFDKFHTDATEYNLAGQVLVQLATKPDVEQALLERLSSLGLRVVDRALSQRVNPQTIDN